MSNLLTPKVLVLGSTGMIGHQVFNYLRNNENYDLYDIAFRKKIHKGTLLIDARDEQNFINHIVKIRPKFIVNCIGVLIESSESDPENAIFLNSYLPHRLARLAHEINAKLIHLSTDCVFSGDKKEPYLEIDKKDGHGVYAKTKGLGEIISDQHLTLRTSVVGPELKSNGTELFHWFMNQSGSVYGFSNVIWSGVTTLILAEVVKWSIDNDIVGLYHVTNNSSINKCDLLNLFRKYTKKDINIIPDRKKNADKSFIDTRLLIDFEIPTYDQMISEMVDLIASNKFLYSQYKCDNNF